MTSSLQPEIKIYRKFLDIYFQAHAASLRGHKVMRSSLQKNTIRSSTFGRLLEIFPVTLSGITLLWTKQGEQELIWLVTLMHLLFYDEDLKPVRMYFI